MKLKASSRVEPGMNEFACLHHCFSIVTVSAEISELTKSSLINFVLKISTWWITAQFQLEGSGTFLVMDAAQLNNGDTVRIESALLPVNLPVCVRFYYFLHGQHINKLVLYTQDENKVRSTWKMWLWEREVWGRASSMGNSVLGWESKTQSLFHLIVKTKKSTIWIMDCTIIVTMLLRGF